MSRSIGKSPYTRRLYLVGTLLAMMSVVGCSGSNPGSSEASADNALWCKEHGVEEKYCVLCHPEIKEDGEMLLCKEHGNIPEAICIACHPELKEKYEACPHDLPKAFCPKCSPEFAATLSEEEKAASETLSGEHDHEHKDESKSEGDQS